MPDISHERCSELMLPYVGGRLQAEDAALVERHLAGCNSCARERAGIMNLIGGPAQGLSSDEKARLHAALDPGALRDEALRPSPAPVARRRWGWPRLAPVLGAAAVALLVLGGGYAALTGGMNGATSGLDGRGGGDAGGAEGAVGEPTREETQKSPMGDQAKRRHEKGSTAFRSASDLASLALESGPPPEPLFERSQSPITSAQLAELAEAKPFGAYSKAYSGADAGRLAGPFLARLAELAATRGGGGRPEQRSAQVESCGRGVLDDRPLAVPAYAAYAVLDGQVALILGFAAGDDPKERLDAFILAAWKRSQDAASSARSCALPLAFESGVLP